MEEEKKRLFELALEIIGEVSEEGFRCHEIARLLKPRLAKAGYRVRVRDGLVLYEVFYFKKILLPYPLQSDNLERVLGVHSWCEYTNGAGKRIIIDWQNAIRLSPNLTVTNNLIVEEAILLPHRYYPCGFSLHKWILIISPFNFSFIKLRFQK